MPNRQQPLDDISPEMRMYGGDEMTTFEDEEADRIAAIEAKQYLQARLEKLGKYIQDLFNRFDSSQTRKDVLKEVKASRRAYDQKAEPTNWPWPQASNMVAPLTTIAVDEVEPRLVAAVIGREPYLKARHHPGISTKEEAELVTQYDNYVLKQKIDVNELVPRAVHDLLLDGTVYPLLSWKRTSRRVKVTYFDSQTGQVEKMIDDLGDTRFRQEAKSHISYEGPAVELIPIDYVWIPDDVDDDDWEDSPLIRYVGDYTINELRRRETLGEEGWYLPEDTELQAMVSETKMKTVQQEEDKVSDWFSDLPVMQKPLECLEAYINFDLLEDGEEVPIIVMVSKETFKVLRVREQIDVFDANIKPIRRLRIFQKSKITWGKPLYSIIAGIQNGTDAMWNRCINSADIVMTPWGFVKRGMSGMRKNRLMISPGVLFEVDDPDAYNFPNLSAFDPTRFVPLILQYMGFFEKSVNVTDFMQGRQSELAGKKGTTATGTMAVLQEGKVKHEYRGGRSRNQFLKLFVNIHNLVAANMPEQEMVAVVGQLIQKYTMSKDYSFELIGSDVVSNRFVDRKENEDFVMTIGPFKDLINPMALLKDILYSYNKRPEEYIDPELNQVVIQFLQQRALMKEFQSMGLTPEAAKQAMAAGATPQDIMQMMKSGGKLAVAADNPPSQPEGDENG